jgi:hypothetical protein
MKRLLILPLLLLAACSGPKPRGGQTQVLAPDEPFTAAKGQAGPDDIARFLAGRPVHHGETLSNWQQAGNYRDHSASMLSNWKHFASRRTGSQREWSENNLRPLLGSTSTVLYPFGGPDLLHAVALFPGASTYVLLGLEPAGGLPGLESADSGAVFGSLKRLETAMSTQLRSGYFITKDMKNDLNGGPMPGVTPILLASLSLMDATVDSVQPLNAGGRTGVDIRFSLPGGGSKRAIYVSGDLSNGGFNGSYRSWLGSYSGSVAYFKAASYLMHDSGFTGIRDWVLGNCRAVVEDDSGIPYRDFDQSKWNVKLFGDYKAPIDLFTKYQQNDLKAAYEGGASAGGLTFGSGYHYQPEEANLLVATKK